MTLCGEKLEELICREIDRECGIIEKKIAGKPELGEMFDSVRKRFDRKMMEKIEDLGLWDDENKNKA